MKTNKVKIKIVSYIGDIPIKIMLQKFCLLRTASRVGDIEIVNHYQLGKLKEQQVVYEVIK